MAEHLDRASSDLLDAHDRANERRLAAPARAEKPGHRTGGDLAAQPWQYGHASPHDSEALDAYRRRSHPRRGAEEESHPAAPPSASGLREHDPTLCLLTRRLTDGDDVRHVGPHGLPRILDHSSR